MAYIERVEDSLGRIQLDLRKALKYPNSDFNFFLRPGDKIVIPKVNDIVTIQGAIGAKFIGQNSRINVAYNKRTRASHYIKKYAGGYDKNAAKRRVYAITVNGQVKKSKFFGMIKPKIEKGDKIIVGTKQKREDKGKDSIDWNGAFENLTVKITAVATLWVLVSRIN